MLFLPGLLSLETQAGPWLPAVSYGVLLWLPEPTSPSGSSLAHGTLGCRTGGPGDEQVSPAFASHAHLPALPPSLRGQGRMPTGGRSHSCFMFSHSSRSHGRSKSWSLGEGRPPLAQGEPLSGPLWDFSPFSSSHPGGGHGWAKARMLPALSPIILLTAPEKLQSRKQGGASLPYYMSHKAMYASISPLPGSSPGSSRAILITAVFTSSIFQGNSDSTNT